MGVVVVKPSDYAQQLYDLLPHGPAWPREGDTPTVRVFEPVANALALAHTQTDGLIDEADARTTSALLVDWERVVGLPDPCLDPPKSTAERRQRVEQRLTFQGGQSAAFFIGLVGSLGYAGSTVKEFVPMRCNSKCNAALNGGGWRYAWRINVPAGANKKAMKCTGRCRDALATWGDPGLACLLNRHKPAHTILFVGYGT